MTEITLSDTRVPSEIRGGEGFYWGIHTTVAPAAATVDDVVTPGFCRHIAGRLAPGDILKVQSIAGLFVAEALVRSVNQSRNGADLVLLSSWKEDEPEFLQAGGIKVEWLGGRARWALVMASDPSQIVRDGIYSRGEAVATLKAMTAGKKPAKVAA